MDTLIVAVLILARPVAVALLIAACIALALALNIVTHPLVQ